MRSVSVCLVVLYALTIGGINLFHTCYGAAEAVPGSTICRHPCCTDPTPAARAAPGSGQSSRLAAGPSSARVHPGPCVACLFASTGQADRILSPIRTEGPFTVRNRVTLADPVPFLRALFRPARPRAPPGRVVYAA